MKYLATTTTKSNCNGFSNVSHEAVATGDNANDWVVEISPIHNFSTNWKAITSEGSEILFNGKI